VKARQRVTSPQREFGPTRGAEESHYGKREAHAGA
jgi:hypothetical protein